MESRGKLGAVLWLGALVAVLVALFIVACVYCAGVSYDVAGACEIHTGHTVCAMN